MIAFFIALKFNSINKIDKDSIKTNWKVFFECWTYKNVEIIVLEE